MRRKTGQQISLEQLLSAVDQEFRVIGRRDLQVSRPAPIDSAARDCLSFCSKDGEQGLEMVRATKASVVICLDIPEMSKVPGIDKTLVLVSNPRLAFIEIVRRLFVSLPEAGTHPTAVLGDNVHLGDEVTIGPNTVVGDECRIGRGTVVEANVTIHQRTKIGERVHIHAGAVIGADGFGFERKQSGEWVNFPQIGGVTIEDDVEIGANACIDRGTLSDTVIGRGSKIDNLVHIAHNVQVGERCIIVALAMVAGSVVVEDDSWIGPQSSVLQKLTVGKNALVGMGSVVLADVPAGMVVVGVPARVLRKNT